MCIRKVKEQLLFRVRLLHCQKFIFKAQHPGLQFPILQAHQDFLGKVKGIRQVFWVTQMQSVHQCKKHDKGFSQCGEFDNYIALKHNSNPLWAEERGICWLPVIRRSPTGMSLMFGSSDCATWRQEPKTVIRSKLATKTLDLNNRSDTTLNDLFCDDTIKLWWQQDSSYSTPSVILNPDPQGPAALHVLDVSLLP